MSTEKSLQQWCGRISRDYGVLCHKFESPGRAGVPDLVLIYEGDVFFCELKSPKGTGRLSELQKMTIDVMRGHGARVHVVASKGEFLQMLSWHGVELTDKHCMGLNNR